MVMRIAAEPVSFVNDTPMLIRCFAIYKKLGAFTDIDNRSDGMANEVQAALMGASVGGLIALVGTVLAAIFESRRLGADASRRDKEWRREKCNEAYSQAIYYLFKLQVSAADGNPSSKDVRQHLSEAQRYLSLLQAYHPSASERQRLSQASDQLRSGLLAPTSISTSAEAARSVVENSLQSTWSPTVRQ